jgi:hypothetical protein
VKLLKYRVTNFRSVVDSGWIDVDDVTLLIGTNESGKTNLLMPLWKLNPAGAGAIDPQADYPRTAFHEIRVMEKKPVFIEAHFQLEDNLVEEIASITGHPAKGLTIASVSRDFDGEYYVSFPNADPTRFHSREAIVELLASARSEIEAMSIAAQKEEPLKEGILATISAELSSFGKPTTEDSKGLHQTEIRQLVARLGRVELGNASTSSTIRPRFERLLSALKGILSEVSRPHPSNVAEAQQLIRDNLLSFVYYAHYGNLDSRIYLPHVIDDMNRVSLGSKEEAKVRTLRVLFDFVKLQPEEILELGRSKVADPAQLTDEELESVTRDRSERSILLNSASSDLTRKFKEWWKQGDYTFRFEADGDFFQILVSDSLRPESTSEKVISALAEASDASSRSRS